MYIHIHIYIYIYIYIRAMAYGQFSGVQSGERNGPGPWDVSTLKGHAEVKISHGSGIRDPQCRVRKLP